jgi:multiple antibiotic resistance protein
VTAYFHSWVHLFFIGFIALFPVVNPVGSAFLVNHYFSGLSYRERMRAVKRISFYALVICVVTMFAGHWILELFGLSVPVVRLAGGIMICKIGWEFLSADKSNVEAEKSQSSAELKTTETLQDKLFYPITFPITTGAGTIAVLFTLSAHADTSDLTQYLHNSSAILASIFAICILIFIFYLNASRLLKVVGPQNEKVLNRLMAFLIFCVGLQIASGGVMQLFKI